MISMEFSIEETIVLIDLLDTTISDIHMEIVQTDNRDYRKMLHERETLLKGLYSRISAKLPAIPIKEAEPA
jgi:hypothetical protein